ncbi:MAG: Crp/Fnr family transcriptional regulator [Sphaerochaetaceae bacterium]|nr:Crp/Fnr family transcriptional regulator [Sphaerochaetaceae bacterium]
MKEILSSTHYTIKNYEKRETVFHLMAPATHIGLILSGQVEAQKSFPNGSQINISVKGKGEMIGPAAVFSKVSKYPCDIIALNSVSIIMLEKNEIMKLMQNNVSILENITREISSAAYMLQQRLELLSYSGIAQKAAFWLLIRSRQSGSSNVQIPGSISRWAMNMNVSRPSLHRELKKMEETGIISYDPPVVCILDREALTNLLG